MIPDLSLRSLQTALPTLPCSSLTYNAKEIRLLLKEEADDTSKWTVEWIIIDPASFTGGRGRGRARVCTRTPCLLC